MQLSASVQSAFQQNFCLRQQHALDAAVFLVMLICAKHHCIHQS